MRRVALALVFAAALGGAARAQDPRSGVKPKATVEVLDDKAQIDDVISRMKQAPPDKQHVDPQPPSELKSQRPPLSTVQPPDKKGQVTPEAKPQHWRSSHRERGSGTPERTERPRHVHP